MEVQVLALYATLLIFPMVIGILYSTVVKKNEYCMVSNWCNGFMICLGLFEVLVLPCIYLKSSLDTLTYLYVLVLLVFCLLSFWINRKEFSGYMTKAFKQLPKMSWCLILALLAVGYQAYMYGTHMYSDADDSFYVATATVAVDTNTVFAYDPYTGNLYKKLPSRYVLSPFPIFTAFLGNLFDIHPAKLAHTWLPVIYLLLAYAVVYLLGKKLLKDNDKALLMIAVTAIIAMYFYTTRHTQNAVMLYRIWQGKAFLAAALLPYTFYLGYRITTEKWNKKDWIIVLFTMLACCLVSSMGIMLGAISLGIAGILAAFIKKDVKVLINAIICCLPNVILAIVYLLL